MFGPVAKRNPNVNHMISMLSITSNKIIPTPHTPEQLFNEFLGLEEPPEVEDLPHCKKQQTAHGEDAEVQHSCVR